MGNKNNKRYKKRRANIHTKKPLTSPYDENTVFVRHWNDLKLVESESHYIKFRMDKGDTMPHSGRILPKEGYDIIINGYNFEGYGYYLSTHTFYGDTYKGSERVLRQCGFNVRLNNWDSKGEL